MLISTQNAYLKKYLKKYIKYNEKNKSLMIGGEKWISHLNTYAIITHGSLLPQKFIVPKGITLVVFESTGNSVELKFTQAMWNIFSNNTPKNISFIKYLSNPADQEYKNSSFPNHNSYEYSSGFMHIDLAGKFKNIHYYRENAEMYDQILSFDPYFSGLVAKVGIYSIPIGIKNNKFQTARNGCQFDKYKSGTLEIDNPMSVPLLKTLECGMINNFPIPDNAEEEDNYESRINKLCGSGTSLKLSEIVKKLAPGTYFVFFCRSSELSDEETGMAREHSKEDEIIEVQQRKNLPDLVKAPKREIFSNTTQNMFKGMFATKK
jgi:hypothetical protein